MERYSRITDKNKREIVLLRAFPCVWGKCTFCDYIEDNGRDEAEMVRENREALIDNQHYPRSLPTVSYYLPPTNIDLYPDTER